MSLRDFQLLLFYLLLSCRSRRAYVLETAFIGDLDDLGGVHRQATFRPNGELEQELKGTGRRQKEAAVQLET